MKYEYVLVVACKKNHIKTIIGCRTLDMLTAMIFHTGKADKIKALTKKEADKLNVKPFLTCMGPAKRKKRAKK